MRLRNQSRATWARSSRLKYDGWIHSMPCSAELSAYPFALRQSCANYTTKKSFWPSEHGILGFLAAALPWRRRIPTPQNKRPPGKAPGLTVPEDPDPEDQRR